jgi:hypothetical protein
VQRVFGKHHQIHRRQIAPGFADHVDDAIGLSRQIRRGCHYRQL